jgi:hypothetical protein
MKKKVFISYAREDQDSASILAHHLQGLGYQVWWDRHVKPGEDFEEKIQSQLDLADKVVAIWSERAAKSSWVRNEAKRAYDAGKLIPVAIDETTLPLGLQHLQVLPTARLEDDFDRVVAAIEDEDARAPPEKLPPDLPTRLLKLAAAGAILILCAAGFYIAYPLIFHECNLRGLDAQLDYRCYRSRKLGVRFVYPLTILELDTTKQGDMTLLLRNLARGGRADVVVTRRPSGSGDIRAARDEEEKRLRREGYVPNHLKPEEGDQWGNFYVITGWKPDQDIFYYKRWFTGRDIVSLEFDYSAKDKRQYDTIIPDMVKERFVLDQ